MILHKVQTTNTCTNDHVYSPSPIKGSSQVKISGFRCCTVGSIKREVMPPLFLWAAFLHPSSGAPLFLRQPRSQAQTAASQRMPSAYQSRSRTAKNKTDLNSGWTRLTCCAVGSLATCRHAAFPKGTLWEPPFMPCSIICILSPDWVAFCSVNIC